MVESQCVDCHRPKSYHRRVLLGCSRADHDGLIEKRNRDVRACRRNGLHACRGTGVGQGPVQWGLCSPGSAELWCLPPHNIVHPMRLLDGGKVRNCLQLWQVALSATVTAATVCHAMSAGMRRIDLTCLIAAPIAVGFLMTYGGSCAAVAVRSAAWCLPSISQQALLAIAFRCKLDLQCCVSSPKQRTSATRSSVSGTSWFGRPRSCCSGTASARRHTSGVGR
jgi:Ferroportin1 (FPN1)